MTGVQTCALPIFPSVAQATALVTPTVLQVQHLTGLSTDDSKNVVSSLQSMISHLQQEGMAEEEILQVLEKHVMHNPALLSIKGVAKGVVALIAIVVIAGFVGSFIGGVSGAVAEELERSAQNGSHGRSHSFGGGRSFGGGPRVRGLFDSDDDDY